MSDFYIPEQGCAVNSYMMRSIFVGVALLFNFHCFSQTLTAQQALEDLNTLQRNLRDYHPGFYRYTTEDSMAYYFKMAQKRVKKSQKVTDLYKEVTHLLSKVRCGHTRPSLPRAANDAFKADQPFLPIAVKYLNKQLFIERMHENGELERGDEILSINGKSTVAITKEIFEHLSADGFIETSKYRLTERNFRYYYQLYIAPDTDRYRLKVKKLDGREVEVSLMGEAWEALESLDLPAAERAVLRLEHREGYSYMKIGTFVSYYLNGAGLDYEDFLESSFAELKEKGSQHLILDLRGNGGGDDNYGALLVSYFAKAPFRYFERIEVTDQYEGYGEIEKQEGRRLMTSHKGLSIWQPQSNRFEGKVYVLTDGRSFSTCADVSTVLHHHGWATLVGEETGGGYDGNTSGYSKTLRLPNSKITVNLPMWMYTTANIGHEYYGRGAIPHVPITQTVEDYLKGKDVVLEKAKALISEN